MHLAVLLLCVRRAGHMEDKPAGAALMSQGAEIDLVYLIVDGLVVVEEERRVAVQHKPAVATHSPSGVATAVSGLVSSSSPSLLSYVFGSAGDDRAHGLMADHSVGPDMRVDATAVSARADSEPGQHVDSTADANGAQQSSAQPAPSLAAQPAPSDGGLVRAVREAAQKGVQVLEDQLAALHAPTKHVVSLPAEPSETEQQHQYQQKHAAHHTPHTPLPTLDEHATQQRHTPPSLSTAAGSLSPAQPTIGSYSPAVHPLASMEPASTASPAVSVVTVLPSASDASSVAVPAAAESERDRRRAERRARRDRRKRERHSGAEGQGSGLPSTLVSVSADGSYEVRRETIGYLRSGRLVGEMSLLTTTAPTAASKARNNDHADGASTNEVAVAAAAGAPASTSALPTASNVQPALALPSSSPSSISGPPASSLLSSLPSPADLLSPTAVSSSSPTIASASVRCVEPCRVLVWRREALRSLFFRFPSLSVGWYATVSSDLIARLSEARHLSLHNGYKLLLLGITAEGSVTAKQRTAADEYRRLNGISSDDHARTLAELGWTEGEWSKGTKKQSWMEAIRAGLPTARRASV